MQNGNRPISAVLHDIVGNFQHIVRSEMRLAKTELSEGLARSRSAAMWLGVGALRSGPVPRRRPTFPRRPRSV